MERGTGGKQKQWQREALRKGGGRRTWTTNQIQHVNITPTRPCITPFWTQSNCLLQPKMILQRFVWNKPTAKMPQACSEVVPSCRVWHGHLKPCEQTAVGSRAWWSDRMADGSEGEQFWEAITMKLQVILCQSHPSRHYWEWLLDRSMRIMEATSWELPKTRLYYPTDTFNSMKWVCTV